MILVAFNKRNVIPRIFGETKQYLRHEPQYSFYADEICVSICYPEYRVRNEVT